MGIRMAGKMMSCCTVCTVWFVALACGAAVLPKAAFDETPGVSSHYPSEKEDVQGMLNVGSKSYPSENEEVNDKVQQRYTLDTRQKSSECPKACICSKHFKTVNCKGKQLRKVPENIPAQVTILYLSGNDITRIRNNSFKYLTNLTELSLNNNEILSIEKGSFINLGKVKRLFLTQNKLTQVGIDIFQGLNSLERLYLGQNQLTTIPELSCLTNLKRLIIDNNNLNSTTFPANYALLKQLTSVSLTNNYDVGKLHRNDFKAFLGGTINKIDLSRCGLKTIDNGTFSDLTSLKSLSLSYNELAARDVDNVIAGIRGSSITSLDLSGMFKNSDIKAETFKPLENVPLQQLFLSRSKEIDVIPKGTFKYFSKLTYLKFDSSSVNIFENGAFDDMNKLERLDIHGNQLHKVPEGLPPNLKILDLSANSIEILEDRSFVLDELTDLDLSNSKLHQINNDAFVGLSSLKTLNLKGNTIGGSSIGLEVFNTLPSLVSLSLEGNKMVKITSKDLFSKLINLEALDMSNNNWNDTPLTIFQPLQQLKNLTLTGNNLKGVIESDTGSNLFSKNKALERVNIDSNFITSLPKNMFKDLTKLTLISLKNNGLTHWDSGAFNGTNLSLLDLSKNSISLVNETSVEGLQNGTRLDLSKNPFACDCDLAWFRNWINTTGVVLVGLDDYQCSSPKKMLGKSILALDTSSSYFQFMCSWLYISIAICGGFAFLLFICICIRIKFKWKIKVWWYLLKRRNRSSGSGGYESIRGEDYLYNAFISACDEDKQWVEDHLLAKLGIPESSSDSEDDNGSTVNENHNSTNGEGRFNLFWREQVTDSAGRGTVDLAGEGIESSQKVIVVFSQDYLQDKYYLEFELQLAIKLKPNNVIYILGDSKISTRAKVPNMYQTFLKEDLTWGEEEGRQDVFWRCLRQELESNQSIN